MCMPGVNFTMFDVNLKERNLITVPSNLKQVLREKKDKVEENIALINGEVNDSPVNVTETSLSANLCELQQLLAEGKCTPISLLRGFQRRVLSLYNAGNSGICEFIMEADQEALDLTISWPYTRAEDRSPLCGIPISIKELCSVKGYDHTFGLIKNCNQPAKEDCVVVQVLREVGAIPFVLTATSPLAFTTSGNNAVFGRMFNPISENHEPGGSSTGEAVLIQQEGSCVGIVTDAMGSIRIPAFFCGLFALKPTTDRVSSKGVAVISNRSIIHMKSTVGVMGRCPDDLAQVMFALLTNRMFSRDPTVVPLPFNWEVYMPREWKPLKIGYYDTFKHPSMIHTVPSIRRAIKEAVAMLRKIGHTLVEFDPPEPFHAFQLALQALFVDGGSEVCRLLVEEPVVPDLTFLKQLASIPNSLTWLADVFSRILYGKQSAIAHTMKTLSGGDVAKLKHDMIEYGETFFDAWCEAGPLDALICPPWAYPSYPRDAKTHLIAPAMAYTVLFNLLDYPAGVVPFGQALESDLTIVPTKNLDRFHKQVHEMQKECVGLPLGVQIVGPRYQEELVLRLMRELHQASTTLQ